MEDVPQLDDDSVFVYPEETNDAVVEAPAHAAPPSSRKINVAQSIRRHKLMCFLIFLSVAVLAVPVVYLRSGRSIYFTESILDVSPIVPKNLIEDRELQLPRYEEFVNQQLSTIVRQEVALEALERMKEQHVAWQWPGEPNRSAADRLSFSLVVKRVPNTTYLSVGMEGSQPGGLAEVVNAVVSAYLQRLKNQLFYDLGLRLEALNKHKLELQEEIRIKTELLARWAKELGVIGIDNRTADDPAARAQERTFVDIRTRRIEAEARLASIELRHEQLRKADLTPEARAQLSTDVELNTRRAALLARKTELKTKLVGLTPEHEGRSAIDRAIASLDAELERADREALGRIKEALEFRRAAKFVEEFQAAELDVQQTKRLEETLNTEADAEGGRTARLNSHYYEIQGIRQDADRLNRQLAAVEDRLDLTKLDFQSPGPVHLVAPAITPDAPIKRSMFSIVAFFVMAAVGLSLGIPMIMDTTDQHVRNPADVELCLRKRPLGWILERTPEVESFVRDQMRRIALSLDRERRLFNRFHFAFTSLRSGGGTTRLVLDLARELRAIGCRVLVIEANALKPDPRLAPMIGRPGLANVLAGEARIEDAVIPARETLPDLVPIGDTGGKKFLPGCRNLSSLLTGLFSRYEIVLVDAPPILVSSDAELLAGVTHAAILVVESETTLIGELGRGIQILRQIGPPLIQVVLNRVRGYSGHGYYSDLVRQYEDAAAARQRLIH
jgi:uncharacterized protein involved in exopolysaccharide biosynthesis/MinD-like ATPase involved in chromosome partitioning or flagellar assembly